jgi:hypothetical protein
MKDLRAHAQWPELEKAKLRCNVARARVLALWPEGAMPADLPPDQKSSLEEAESAVIKDDDAYKTLLDAITSDVDAGNYGHASP